MNKMRKYSTLFYILLMFTSLFIIVFYLLFKKQSNNIIRYEKFTIEQEQRIRELTAEIEDFIEYYNIILSVNRNTINPHLKLISENNEIIKISDLTFDSPKLIFRYSDINCNVCIEHEICLLKSILGKVDSNDVLVIANYQSKRALDIFKRMNSFEYNIYKAEDLGLGMDQFSVPYYLIIDASYNIVRLFIPHKNHSELTEAFYEAFLKFR